MKKEEINKIIRMELKEKGVKIKKTDVDEVLNCLGVIFYHNAVAVSSIITTGKFLMSEQCKKKN